MDEEQSRKLAVILHADVVGSTSLVQRDETLAHSRIQDVFRRLSEQVTSYGGTVHELRGDALIAEFSRASDAVCAALRFQQLNSEHNTTLDASIAPQTRIGLALGEVVFADDTVTGAGVVLAQRVEQLAAPDGVCVTGAIHEAIPQRLPFDEEDLGERNLKGFEKPTHIYRLFLKSGENVPDPETGINTRRYFRVRRLIAMSVAVVLVVAGGVFLWLKPWEHREEPAAVERAAFPLPDKPSIAVLPFDNLSGDPEQEYFADGIAEDLTTDLSKISSLFVIARNSAFTYKGQSIDPKQVARELGVRYVLEGSVRRSKATVRVNAQLIDTTTGGHVWAERYDGEYEDVFSLQDKVTSKIVTTLALRLTKGERDQLTRRETESAEAYDIFLKGWDQYVRQTPESFRQAIVLFKRALELDGGYSRAHAALSLTYWLGWKNYWFYELLGRTGHPHDLRIIAEEHLLKAMEDPTPLARQVATAMHAQWRRYDEAVSEGERAIALDPNDANGYVALAGAFNLKGEPDPALELMESAMRLNPRYPTSYLHELGLALFNMEQYEQAATNLRRAVTLNPEDRWSSRLLIASLGHLGLETEAAVVIEKTEDNAGGIDPLSIRGVAFWYPFKDSEDAERLASGLRAAGVPE